MDTQPARESTTVSGPQYVAVDAMGGDFAPQEIVQGAVQAAREFRVGIKLVGPQDVISAELTKMSTSGLDISVVHTDEVIAMDEHPAEAVRLKRRNTITVAHELELAMATVPLECVV